MGDRYQALRNAYRDYRKNDGVLCVDTEMELVMCGYDPCMVADDFDFGETPQSIIEKEEEK